MHTPRITKVYESETYDYPTQIQESISELSTSIGYGITNFAAANLKGTNLPAPAPAMPPAHQHKTLPHALGRAATTAAQAVQSAVPAGAGTEDKLGSGLALYASGWDKIASARLHQDASIQANFLHPWQQTLNTSISVAMKARQAVKVSRLELDAAKQSCVHLHEYQLCPANSPYVSRLKTASPARQEQARLEVENAEDDLVQKTEVAITLMKTVLENVSMIIVSVSENMFDWRCHRPARTPQEPERACQGAADVLRHSCGGPARRARRHRRPQRSSGRRIQVRFFVTAPPGKLRLIYVPPRKSRDH